MTKAGKWVTTADLSLEYGFKDIEGNVHAFQYVTNSTVKIEATRRFKLIDFYTNENASFAGNTPLNIRSLRGILQVSGSSLAPYIPGWIRLPWWLIAMATHHF